MTKSESGSQSRYIYRVHLPETCPGTRTTRTGPIAGPAEFQKRTDADIRHHAAKHETLKESGHFTLNDLEVMMKATGIKFPSEFSRLPYWDEANDYLISAIPGFATQSPAIQGFAIQSSAVQGFSI